jgi:hypothetical protein
VVNGTATIILGDNSFRVIVVMTGLAPNSTHPSHIHTGSSCTANGSVAYALQSVVADANGNASAISTVPVAYAVPATGWYVNVHEGPTLDGAGGTPIACTLLN